MTCIVGLEIAGGVIIGGDSAAISGRDRTVTRLAKVFQWGEFLFGYTSSFRMGQLLQYRLTVDPQTSERSDLEYLSTVFVDKLRECLQNGGYKITKDGQEEGGNFLLGYRGKLYSIESDFHVNSSEDGYMAVGCGANYALGSLHSTGLGGNSWATPEARVIMALEAAGHFSTGVFPPYYAKTILISKHSSGE